MAYDKVTDSSKLDADLTSVADAIRTKSGTTGELAFPDGFVSTVNDISSVSDLSNAKDIAFGGNESGGKYVIEDETITPLFNQVKRITETEEALTFEKATVSLLNIGPGGGGLMFASTASGRIPEYEKGTAESTLALSGLFESSAVGALQEE